MSDKEGFSGDINSAMKLLREGNFTCVLCRGDTLHTSTLHGVAPMVEYLNSGTDLKGFSAADKISGKAAALLFVLAGVKEVYAEVISEPAVEALSRFDIRASYGAITSKILNRAGTDSCPMEKAVEKVDDPQTAFEKIKETIAAMRK